YRAGCPPGPLEFDSSALFMLGARSLIGPGFITAQIMVLIDNGYFGWLTVRREITAATQWRGWWQQAQSSYGGPGITSARAPLFQVRIFPGSLSTQVEEGLATTVVGTLELSIR